MCLRLHQRLRAITLLSNCVTIVVAPPPLNFISFILNVLELYIGSKFLPALPMSLIDGVSLGLNCLFRYILCLS